MLVNEKDKIILKFFNHTKVYWKQNEGLIHFYQWSLSII